MIRATESLGREVFANKLVSFANILVATDFSPVSDRALEYALSVARRYDSQIYLAHVIPVSADAMLAPEIAITSNDTQRRAAEEEIAAILESGRLRGVPHEVVIEEGALWPAVERLVKKYDIDLIVVGTHGSGAVRKMLLGSGAEEIFRQARRPVLTVGPAVGGETRREVAYRNILLATNFGVGAEREAAYAFSLAQEHSARLTLLNVIPHAGDSAEPGMAAERDQMARQLKELLPAGSEAWCCPEFRTAVGEPVEQILRVAAEIQADLIVMGAKPRKGLAGHVPHTKASRVVGSAPCPVLTIKS